MPKAKTIVDSGKSNGPPGPLCDIERYREVHFVPWGRQRKTVAGDCR